MCFKFQKLGDPKPVTMDPSWVRKRNQTRYVESPTGVPPFRSLGKTKTGGIVRIKMEGWEENRTALTLNPCVPHPMFPPFVISLKPAKPFLYKTGLRKPKVGNPTLNR